MDPFLTVTINMALVPGVRGTGLSHSGDTVRIEVTGGHPQAVAEMIYRCLPPDVQTKGNTCVVFEGRPIRFDHKDPDFTQPSHVQTPLSVVNPEGTHRPQGPQLVPSTRRTWPWFVGSMLLALLFVLSILWTFKGHP